MSNVRTMRNVQVIDGAINCVYDIFAATDEEFALIFPAGQDVAFISEVLARGKSASLDAAFEQIWRRRVPKAEVVGIHGLLFYELEEKIRYYPTRSDEEAVNPDAHAFDESHYRSAMRPNPHVERSSQGPRCAPCAATHVAR